MSEQQYFTAKIEDLIRRVANGEQTVFSGFLTGEEAGEAAAVCKRNHAPYFLYGGYEESERKILAVSEYDADLLKQCFPITLLQLVGGDLSQLTNRDVLGALMATGIRRDVLGDIVVRDGQALVFVAEHIKEFLMQNITSVGRQTVKLAEAPAVYTIPAPHFEHIRTTVASLRVDAVVGGLGRVSREQANRLIEGKLVSINHSIIEKRTKDVCAGDCIVIRGMGKWIVDECDALTKKGRAVLVCRKYI
jgi:RNA-binding protein YlmH